MNNIQYMKYKSLFSRLMKIKKNKKNRIGIWTYLIFFYKNWINYIYMVLTISFQLKIYRRFELDIWGFCYTSYDYMLAMVSGNLVDIVDYGVNL